MTPIVEAWHRKGRISAISAVTVSPVRRRPDLVFRLLEDDRSAHGEDTAAFLAQLRGELRGPMTVLWDQSRIHRRSGVVRAYLARHPGIITEDFPGYAPEANPDEGVWGWSKYHRMPNYAPEGTAELRSHLWHELSSLRGRRDLLASFLRHAEIPIPLRLERPSRLPCWCQYPLVHASPGWVSGGRDARSAIARCRSA